MLIFLLGYMASGKTTLGRYYAQRRGWRFVDTDEYIESKEGMAVSDIFESKGEEYFRKLEAESIREIALLKEDTVVATGGGLPCYCDNMKIINKSGISVYLRCDSAVLTDRLMVLGKDRPLVNGKTKTELLEYIDLAVADRERFYRKADYVCDTTVFDENSLANQIDEFIALL